MTVPLPNDTVTPKMQDLAEKNEDWVNIPYAELNLWLTNELLYKTDWTCCFFCMKWLFGADTEKIFFFFNVNTWQ